MVEERMRMHTRDRKKCGGEKVRWYRHVSTLSCDALTNYHFTVVTYTLHIATMQVPSKQISRCNGIYGFKEGEIDLIITHLRHCQSCVCTISSEMVFHGRESEFNWIVVRWIWRQKFDTHSPKAPCEKKIQREFCLVHHLSRILCWISGCLWIWQLSMTITELGAGYGCM